MAKCVLVGNAQVVEHETRHGRLSPLPYMSINYRRNTTNNENLQIHWIVRAVITAPS